MRWQKLMLEDLDQELFGVIAYAVSERTREIGIRLALGAKPGEVFRLVVGQGMMLALIGLLVGLPLALGMGRAVAGLLYGVAPTDFATFASVAVLLRSPPVTSLHAAPCGSIPSWRCDTNNSLPEQRARPMQPGFARRFFLGSDMSGIAERA